MLLHNSTIATPPRTQRAALLACCFTAFLGLAANPVFGEESANSKREEYTEFNYGENKGGDEWTQAIRVTEPVLRSEVQGDVTVRFQAPGMQRAQASCWQQPKDPSKNPWGHDETLVPQGISLDAEGRGSFVFNADRFPNGPINIRIFAQNDEGKRDIFELQLFNKGGIAWDQGIPKTNPPGAKGLKLLFSEDFDGPLSISNDGRGERFNAHKPGGGDFSGWQFSDILGAGKPFEQKGTWLRIAARKDEESPKGRSGIIASVDKDFKGFWVKAPAYLECRFTAQSAIGTWPAFWTLALSGEGTDELDIVEAYGGMGKGNPNHPGYSIVSHFWSQKNPDGTPKKTLSEVPKIMELGGKSYWSTTFHTYGVSIGLEDTVYYFDDIEVMRHPTNNISRDYPHFFLVNYAIGGISRWPIDLERYGNGTDMWVDYIRVYGDKPVSPDYRPDLTPKAEIQTSGIGLNFSVLGDATTELEDKDVAGAPGVSQSHWNSLSSARGERVDLRDSSGKPVPGLSAEWSVPSGDNAWRSKAGQDWGFKGNNWKLQKGYIQLGGKLTVSGVPYSKYQVYVYLGGDANTGSGSVSISSSSGEVDPNGTYYYKLGWNGGKFVKSSATTKETAANANFVVFSGNTAKEFTLDWVGNLSGGWSGVTGIQIVKTP